jgi:predicted enzyme related to lactoylglutathione lyase
MEGTMPHYVIDYFELPSSDPQASGDFFARAFGWGQQSYGPSYMEIHDAGVLGGLSSDEAENSSLPVVGIRTDDIAAAERAVRAAGGEITRPAYAYPGGMRFFFRVPGGAEMLVYRPD